MEKRWVILPEPPRDIIVKLIEEIGVSRPLATLLAHREISNFNEARSFFRPDIEALHNPFDLLGMKNAVNRIEEAIAGGENILIYGDYDVDGTTAVALLFEYLHADYPQIGYYIPDRYKEGYGVSQKGIDFAIDNSFSLIIALDCGIKAIEQVAYAKANGIDFIICDHHLPGEQLPEAIILNPKQPGCTYPFKELSGCGVGFKLVQAIQETRGEDFDDIRPLLDLVMVSIGADIVSMTGENRLLAHYGLELLNSAPRIGFKRLLQLANSHGPLSVSDVVFSIAPRINAAGRIDSGNRAVELLLAKDEAEVAEIAQLIHNHNEVRKGLDRLTTTQALTQIEEDEWLLNSKSTVVFNAEWHKGIVGIVASRLIETYYRPTIVLTEANGVAVGSARSVKGFNIYKALEQCADLLTQFGGHNFAAGLTLPVENIPALKMRFNEEVNKTLTPKMLIPEVTIDVAIDFRDIFENQRGGIPKFYRILRQLAPFGPDNMTPVFMSRGVRDSGYARVLKEKHLKMRLYQPEYPDIMIEAIGFDLGHMYDFVKENSFDIAYCIDLNYWQGQSRLQLMIKAIRPASDTPNKHWL